MLRPKSSPAHAEVTTANPIDKCHARHWSSHIKAPQRMPKKAPMRSVSVRNPKKNGGGTWKPSAHSSRKSGGATVYELTPCLCRSVIRRSTFCRCVRLLIPADMEQTPRKDSQLSD